MNSWNLAGTILKHGIMGKEYPKLWVQVELNAPKELTLPNNKFFINFDLDNNPSSKNGRAGEYVKSRLTTHTFFFIHDAMIAKLSKSKKQEDGTWTKEEIIGVKGKISNITFYNKRVEAINLGLVQGKVLSFNHDTTTNTSKFLVEERYRNVKTGEWKSREIPLLHIGSVGEDLTNKYVFVTAFLCGTTPDNQSKIYGLVKNLIIT